jgi:hypothetical protein
MKQPIGKIKVEEVENEGFAAFFGKPILLYCANYFYNGILVGINDEFVKLDKASIVYETGPLDAKSFKLAESIAGPHYVLKAMIESFCAGK